MNPGAQGFLRTWPDSGKWAVALSRDPTGNLFCLLLTGSRNDQTGDLYFWGMKHFQNVWSAVVVDRNPAAVAGDQIDILVDGTQVGRFIVTHRASNQGMYTLRADMSDSESKRIIKLMILGDNFRFVTDGSTYSVPLRGIAHALLNMSNCDAEAESLQRK